MLKTHRTIIVIIILLGVIGVGLYTRSYYVRTDGRYLLGFDPYYHYRMAETISEQGSRPEWDMIAAYPTGAPVSQPPFLHYYLAYTYTVVSAVSHISLFQYCMYASVIPVILTIVVAYYAGKVLTNEVGGIFTALLVAVNGAISSSTIIGNTDADVWVILFSLVATYFLFSAIKNEKNYIWSALLGVFLFLFALTWSGYWYLILLVIGAFVVWFLADAVRKEVDSNLLSILTVSLAVFALLLTSYRGYHMIALVLGILALVWILGERFLAAHARRIGIPILCAMIIGVVLYVLHGERIFSEAVKTIGSLLVSSSPEEAVFLPDVSVSVLQQHDITISTMASLFGLLLLLAPLGMLFLAFKRDKFSLQSLVYLGLYSGGTGLLLLIGSKYAMLFAVPLVLAGGVFFGSLPELLKGKVTSTGVTAVIIICALSVVPSYIESANVSRTSSTMNDDLWELLNWIDETLPENAVVVSGWDMGFWIESIGRRKSVMNHDSYDIWWRVVKFGKAMETQDEETAVKEIYGFSNLSEVEALREVPEDNDWILKKEMEGFAEDDAYVLVSEWTILTFYWISYFGSWNYATGQGEGRIYSPIWAQEARKLVSGTDYIYGDPTVAFSVIREGNNFHSFILTEEEYVPTLGTLFLKDETVCFLKREDGQLGVIYVPYQSMPYFNIEPLWPDMPSEVLFINGGDLEYMLTKLYFFNGEGLHHFELVKDFKTAKLYKVHKTAQEFDQGILTEEDTYQPI
jgi:hypothetical protein